LLIVNQLCGLSASSGLSSADVTEVLVAAAVLAHACGIEHDPEDAVLAVWNLKGAGQLDSKQLVLLLHTAFQRGITMAMRSVSMCMQMRPPLQLLSSVQVV
jgi:hypothetical protein